MMASFSKGGQPPKVVLAKPGMDGHNLGIATILRALRDDGCEVVYLGIRRRAIDIARAALEEDADVVGLSLLSGAHLGLTQEVVEALRDVGCDASVVIGGIIPEADHQRLRELGAAAIFTPGAGLQDICKRVRDVAVSRRQAGVT